MSVLPMKCRRYLVKRDVPFEEHEEGDQKAVILKAFCTTDGAFRRPVGRHLGTAAEWISRHSTRYVSTRSHG